MDDPEKERKPTPKIRDDLLNQLAEKKRQTINQLRDKTIEIEKSEMEKPPKRKESAHITPDHVRRAGGGGLKSQFLLKCHLLFLHVLLIIIDVL